jgi:hypothetical protein
MSKKSNDDAARKAYEAGRKQQAALLEDARPLSKRDLCQLFDCLNRKGASSCDHTLKATTEFLRDRKLPADKILPWLRGLGGHCDCEVIYNVEDKFSELVRPA